MLRKSRARCKGGVEVLIIVLETRAPGFWLGKEQSKEKGKESLRDSSVSGDISFGKCLLDSSF